MVSVNSVFDLLSRSIVIEPRRDTDQRGFCFPLRGLYQ